MSHNVEISSHLASKLTMTEEKLLWKREYDTLKIIPSTTRESPSKALVIFSEILQFEQCRRVLDVGCGTGRNSIYLASRDCTVDALDFCDSALAELQKRAAGLGVTDKIGTRCLPVDGDLPFEKDAFDLALDVYLLCHFYDESRKNRYREELRRVLKPDGKLVSVVFSLEDQYYRRLANGNVHNGIVVVDKANGIPKQLYDEEGIRNFWGRSFEIPYFVKLEFYDIVQGQRYHRSIFSLALTK